MSAVFDKEFRVEKVDRENGVVYGFAIVSTENGSPYFDLHGDWIPDDAMAKAAEEFMTNYRVGKDQHQGEQVGDIVFGMALTKDVLSSSGMTSNKTGFFIGYKPQDPVHFDMIASGERTGFSMGGYLYDHEETEIGKAVWSTSYVNDLPDSAFLYVESGSKDADGKTTPRTKRHFPVKDKGGTVDAAHVKNALSRIGSASVPAAAKEKARKKAESMLASLNKSYGSNGKKRGRIFRSFAIREISLVDRPAQEGATIATVKTVIASAPIAKKVVLTSKNDGHQHLVFLDRIMDDGDYDCTTYDYTSDDNSGHTHKILVEGGKLVLSANAGHGHTVDVPEGWTPKIPSPPASATAPGVEVVALSESSTENDDAKSTGKSDVDPRDLRTESGARSVTPESTMETKMTEAEIAALKDALVRAEKRAERAEAIAAMTPAMQSYFGKLSASDQSSFVAKSTSERQSVLDSAVAYKAADGTVYFSFDDARLIGMAKSFDQQAKTIADRESAAQQATFTAKAATTIGAMPGELATHVAIVAAVSSISDEKLRDACFATLKGANEAVEYLAKASGHGVADVPGANQAGLGSYEAKFAEWAKKNNVDTSSEVSKARAQRDFNKSAEGAAAYTAYVNGK